ncbi:hypothetical protein AVEN_62406-1 [Araneus ventricosus]|uniref:Uncharacterized protein n=1 Tax=Araneus ventricosus TaxID=182803 RepID=A0A4Y2TUD4_ARAVE|nr:hypothetical protein AVEN_62406-1 [Araneus ventricosus]
MNNTQLSDLFNAIGNKNRPVSIFFNPPQSNSGIRPECDFNTCCINRLDNRINKSCSDATSNKPSIPTLECSKMLKEPLCSFEAVRERLEQ